SSTRDTPSMPGPGVQASCATAVATPHTTAKQARTAALSIPMFPPSCPGVALRVGFACCMPPSRGQGAETEEELSQARLRVSVPQLVLRRTMCHAGTMSATPLATGNLAPDPALLGIGSDRGESDGITIFAGADGGDHRQPLRLPDGARGCCG